MTKLNSSPEDQVCSSRAQGALKPTYKKDISTQSLLYSTKARA